jgi:hypothetical protein
MKGFVVWLLIAVAVIAAIAEWYREREKDAERAATYEAERILGRRPRLIDPFNDELMAEPTVQRFVPVTKGGSNTNFAMDTQTGRLCRTWDWIVISGEHQAEGMDAIPTCRAMLISDGEYIQRRAESMKR